MPTITVYPPDEEGARAVRIDGVLAGRVRSVEGVAVLARAAGAVDLGGVVWRGGGPDVWEH